MMTRARAAFLLLLALCVALPARAQAPDSTPCVRASQASESELVRWDCAGSGPRARVRFSVSLPAGFTVRQSQGWNVQLMAERGAARVRVQAADQLWESVTAADTAEFWAFAAELVLGRAPTPREVGELRRDAGDEDGARFMVSRTQRTDSGLVALASALATALPGVETVGQMREIRTLGGLRAGYLNEITRRDGEISESEGWGTVQDAVFYGIVIAAPDAEYRANRALWERVVASFTLHPAER
ncbi:MAG TPA: hypothetical protein VLK84_26325 [Longimicrobium sp.]|nr:hypothetical protein [Longimicrobium sp.]